jgi:hypothetical protein
MGTRVDLQMKRVSAACLFFLVSSRLCAQSLPLVSDVELQPLAAHAERVVQALELAGSPLDKDSRRRFALRSQATMKPPLLRRSSGFWTLCVWWASRSTPKAA